MKAQLWKIRPLQPQAAAQFAKLQIPSLACAVLAARGIDADAAAALLSAEEVLCDPLLLCDVQCAAKTISEAIENGEFFCVFGDYDCDGVAATAMVTDYLEACGARVCYYIPHREKEGYGLNKHAIDELFRLGVTLIVTVDNGVTAIDEIAYAYSLGMRVVVTDHHQPRETLPCAEAVLNPHRADCPYPDKNLSGVGVAFKLLCVLEGERGWCLLEQYAELLALGTVADVVELTGENRCFVRRGLRAMQDTQRPGLRALIRLAGLDAHVLTAGSIAFGIAPRINAAGRIDTAELAVMLLLTESEQEAQALSEQLEELNAIRRADEKTVVDDIAIQLQQNPALALHRVMVLSGTGWNAGIVGIVCSRLVERFDRPVLILAENETSAKGSGRSVEGFSLIEAIKACSQRLTHYGGHPMAAGFSLASCDIEAFSGELEAYAASHYPEMPSPSLRIDCVVLPSQLTVEQVQSLDCLEPFGAGNELPVFAVMEARLDKIIPLSEGKHLKLRFSKGGESFFVLCFSTRIEQLGAEPGDLLDVAFTVSLNEYQGETSVSLKYKGMRLSGTDTAALWSGRQRYEAYRRGESLNGGLIPTRDEMAVLYRYLRRKKSVQNLPDAIYGHVAQESMLDYTRFRIALDVLLELGLISQNDEGRLTAHPSAQKVDLKSSAIVRSLSVTL